MTGDQFLTTAINSILKIILHSNLEDCTDLITHAKEVTSNICSLIMNGRLTAIKMYWKKLFFKFETFNPTTRQNMAILVLLVKAAYSDDKFSIEEKNVLFWHLFNFDDGKENAGKSIEDIIRNINDHKKEFVYILNKLRNSYYFKKSSTKYLCEMITEFEAKKYLYQGILSIIFADGVLDKRELYYLNNVRKYLNITEYESNNLEYEIIKDTKCSIYFPDNGRMLVKLLETVAWLFWRDKYWDCNEFIVIEKLLMEIEKSKIYFKHYLKKELNINSHRDISFIRNIICFYDKDIKLLKLNEAFPTLFFRIEFYKLLFSIVKYIGINSATPISNRKYNIGLAEIINTLKLPKDIIETAETEINEIFSELNPNLDLSSPFLQAVKTISGIKSFSNITN